MEKITTIHKCVRRGCDSNHQNFCEDFLATYESAGHIIGACFDGCSGAVHSHFASALMGKVFNNVMRQHLPGVEHVFTPEGLAGYIMWEFVQKLFQTKMYLRMEDNDY